MAPGLESVTIKVILTAEQTEHAYKQANSIILSQLNSRTKSEPTINLSETAPHIVSSIGHKAQSLLTQVLLLVKRKVSISDLSLSRKNKNLAILQTKRAIKVLFPFSDELLAFLGLTSMAAPI